MGLFQRFKSGLVKTQTKLNQEIKRIVSRSPKLTGDALEEMEAALLGADLGMSMTTRIIEAARLAYESQGKSGLDFLEVARGEVAQSLARPDTALVQAPGGLTAISLVGVNGTGKTTTSAKLAHRIQSEKGSAVLAACDTFRAAAIEQLKLWGQRLHIPVIAGEYGADAAAVAHDAVMAAQSRRATHLIIDTAGRLHTKHNLMQELHKLHRVIERKLPGAPHEVLLVVDASTGLNARNQAREFHKIVPLTGLVVTKLDGTSKGGVVVAIQKELDVPVKFVGLGEQPDDLQPFDAEQFAEALFSDGNPAKS